MILVITMANTTRTSEVDKYNKMSIAQKRDYLNSLSRDDLADFERDLGYQEGYEQGVKTAQNKVSIVDDMVALTSKKTKITIAYIFAIIVLLTGIVYMTVPTKLSLSILGSTLGVQTYFTVQLLLKGK